VSQYTTDEVLQMLEEWAKDNPGDPSCRFLGFAGLLGKDLNFIDLSNTTIQQKAREYKEGHGGQVPPWVGFFHGSTDVPPGINLSGAILSSNVEGSRVILLGAQLQGADLQRSQLQGTNLSGAKLQDADLSNTQLRGANLSGAQLQGADLQDAQLQEANLVGARLGGAYLRGARLQRADLRGAEFEEAHLEDVDWSGKNGYVLDESHRRDAEAVYRRLKRWYTDSGQYHHAGEFHKHEMDRRREVLWYSRSISAKSEWLPVWLLWWTCGYGERPYWTLGWVFFGWVGFALLYLALGALGEQVLPEGFFASLWATLWYSASAMLTFEPRLLPGYPPVAVSPWAGTVALLQGAIAYFLLALFLVTFVQKASRQ
jgi:hypothetical protein